MAVLSMNIVIKKLFLTGCRNQFFALTIDDTKWSVQNTVARKRVRLKKHMEILGFLILENQICGLLFKN
jgi:hypothetical protein